jgi:hypothetical protein
MSKKHKPSNEVVQDDDLIKVKVVKKKHFDQLLDPVCHGESKFSEDQVEFLYYVRSRDAVLCRSKHNGHLRAVCAMTIVRSAVEDPAVGPDAWKEARNGAWTRIHALPQLLID